MTTNSERRHQMVQRQLSARGISDPLVLAAMERVPRESFVPDHLEADAYLDQPLPIGQGQTISQPYIVAFMIAALRLRSSDKVLEVGAGSGYAAAVLAEIAEEVFAIERHGRLAEGAAQTHGELGYVNVQIRHGDGTMGWLEAAPFDAILVSAGAPAIPEALKSQLARGGRMVIPVGDDRSVQRLLRITRHEDGTFEQEIFASVRFVPLVGDQGWQA